MKAMILAAGRGERLRPLTDTTPKPLLLAGGKPLIVWHLERLAAAGWCEVVINHAHLGEQIVATLGDGRAFGLNIAYSPEPAGALETAGGIAAALPLLGAHPFLAVNGDIWCDWDFSRACHLAHTLGKQDAHLIMVDNPRHHPDGDFCLDGDAIIEAGDGNGSALTYAGIALFRPDFFSTVPVGATMKLRPLLDDGIARRKISGERHAGQWVDVGTPARLVELDMELAHQGKL
ncbi:Nucleotidyl transferase [Candidatus Accumulibacter aalborgensis]|uniref:Nucleotidyl transferase n=1 Tax=Candidatus Accumulibacter aalborgensis TaxID=1860102 RepID=A0A1A8XN60_9PROT|nr:nucleotidyltransferase family protein [Candidatus Accumulibacter aalborgensis]SBT05383.1 Nucleotidyl transferase [Candidatus Accumulibacter aalborgensis]